MAEPRIRFKRDDGSVFPEWKEDCIGNMFSVTRGYVLAVQKTRQEQDSEYLYPVYSSQTKNDGRLGYYNEYLYEDAITWTTDGANAGTVKFRKGKFYCTNVCGVLLEDKVKPNLCIAEILNIATIPWVTHNGNPKLMNNVMSEIRIKYPSSFEEQQKIADFLSSVDDVIATSEQEIANLEIQKKAVMKKIFSQEVRFKRDDGSDFPDWEEKPLNKVVSVYDGTHQTPKYVSKGVKFVSVENINNLYGTSKYITQDAFNKQYKNNVPQRGDVLMTRIGDIGTATIVSSDEQLAYYVSLALLKPLKEILGDYLVQEIAGPYFQNELWEKTLHTAYPKKINKEDIGKCIVQLPCLEEQRLIADFLFNFDEAIKSAKKELELWKQLKKGLLQQMFV